MLVEIEAATYATSLGFGAGNVGEADHVLPEDRPTVMDAAAEATKEHGETCPPCFDCMDGRRTLRIIQGADAAVIDDETEINERIAGQLAGGSGLAFTKAAVAANATYLREANSFEEAYDITVAKLAELGVYDAAHEGCGATKLVQKSVEEPLSVEAVAAAVGTTDEVTLHRLATIATTKAKRVAEGFYSNWSPELHREKVRANGGEYLILETADDDVSGHHEAGLLVLKKGQYFVKNKFIDATDKQLFVLTLEDADVIAERLGADDEERAFIKLALRDDSFCVANHIVAPGLDVYA